MDLLKQKNDSALFSFTGCRGGEGVSTILVNLAIYLASSEGDSKVLLVDANFTNPVLHDALDTGIGNGLSDILKGSSSWSDSVSSTSFDNLHFLSCGGSYQQLEGSLDQGRLRGAMAEIKGMYDCILVDSPAILTSGDSLTLSVASDATFLVIQSLRTPKEVAERARSLLDDNECDIGGVLLNRVKQVIPGWMYKML
jgi:Mrp family chromosome partitioning ATPase